MGPFTVLFPFYPPPFSPTPLSQITVDRLRTGSGLCPSRNARFLSEHSKKIEILSWSRASPLDPFRFFLQYFFFILCETRLPFESPCPLFDGPTAVNSFTP